MERLLRQADSSGRELVGPGGLRTELIRRVPERALDTETADHLGYEPGDKAGSGSPRTMPTAGVNASRSPDTAAHQARV
ncbi:hypothetical protein [Sciscionella marina]|uniref:hypothetical protein n=1 Tax=Sciscionella marina TaxID=508770 RepID=UPI0012F6BB34|nr:hypothetical protein [Sciscionella marina]